MAEGTDYLPVAVEPGSNVDSQADFAGSGYQLIGFNTGIALPQQANKVWRQASMMAAAWANLIAQTLNIYVPDDGNLAELIAWLQQTIKDLVTQLTVVTFSATPVFDANNGNIFEIFLAGNVTGSTFVNGRVGTFYTFIIHTGGIGANYTFVWPTNIPGATPISTTRNTAIVQQFVMGSNGNLYPVTAQTLSNT
jgi:hypothetical protein